MPQQSQADHERPSVVTEVFGEAMTQDGGGVGGKAGGIGTRNDLDESDVKT